MGRQTAIVATEEDERALLTFLRSSDEIRILVHSAPTAEQLWVSEFAPFDRFHRQYYLWNCAFPWTPDIRDLRPARDLVVVWDTATAPLIEFSRTDIAWLFRPDNTLLVAGSRLYWCKHHMADKLAYDADKFSRWYDRVIRWVRKVGKREPAIAGCPYLLPDVWRRWQLRKGVAESEVAPDCGGIA
jgi:hypothetical protein